MKSLRSASVFLSESQAIAAARHYNGAGILYEQAAPQVVDDWHHNDTLSSVLRSALERFSRKEANLRIVKLRDWPSYLASGYRSVAEFERRYLRVDISALNEAELFFEARVTPTGERNLSLCSLLTPFGPEDEFAEPLKRLFKLCSQWDSML
jgi:hypothetical protein